MVVVHLVKISSPRIRNIFPQAAAETCWQVEINLLPSPYPPHAHTPLSSACSRDTQGALPDMTPSSSSTGEELNIWLKKISKVFVCVFSLNSKGYKSTCGSTERRGGKKEKKNPPLGNTGDKGQRKEGRMWLTIVTSHLTGDQSIGYLPCLYWIHSKEKKSHSSKGKLILN